MSIIDKIKSLFSQVSEADVAEKAASAATSLFDEAAELLEFAAGTQDKLAALSIEAADGLRDAADYAEREAAELQASADENTARAARIRAFFG